MDTTLALTAGNHSEAVVRRIAAFQNRFGNAHLLFACHAAFPLALTPDLLYRLWAYFQQDINGVVINIPWVAVSDLLLSNLCSEVGYELFEMDIRTRTELLNMLKQNPRFGAPRIEQLSDFVLDYVHKKLNSINEEIRDFAQVQQWTVLAYTRPDEAAQRLALALRQAYIQGKTETMRIASIIETFAEPLSGFQPLLMYAAGIKALFRNRTAEALQLFDGLSKDIETSVRVAGVGLNIPEEILDQQVQRTWNEVARLVIEENWAEAKQAIQTISKVRPFMDGLVAMLMYVNSKLGLQEETPQPAPPEKSQTSIESVLEGLDEVEESPIQRNAANVAGTRTDKALDLTWQDRFTKLLTLSELGLLQSEIAQFQHVIREDHFSEIVKGLVDRGKYTIALHLIEKRLEIGEDKEALRLCAEIVESSKASLNHRIYAADLVSRAVDLRSGVCTLTPAWSIPFVEQHYEFSYGSVPIRVSLPDYQIARYPVTVWQFFQFWKAGGYREERWWTTQGWQWVKTGGWQLFHTSRGPVEQPKFRDKPFWFLRNQPIAGVSWYEAMAYCAWLTEHGHLEGWLDDNTVIRLPSEAEWVVAAKWDAVRRTMQQWTSEGHAPFRQNVREVGIGRPSAVGMFPEGASPCGALDMAGNIWEWCSSHNSDFPERSFRRQPDFLPGDWNAVLRGGSFGSRNSHAGWDARFVFGASFQLGYFGFRVCRSRKTSRA